MVAVHGFTRKSAAAAHDLSTHTTCTHKTQPPQRTLLHRRHCAVALAIHRGVGQRAPELSGVGAGGAQRGAEGGAVARHQRDGAQAVVLLQEHLCRMGMGWWGGSTVQAGLVAGVQNC